MSEMIGFKEAEGKVLELRDQHVILDSSVAELYGVETKRINEAVANNPDKFRGLYRCVEFGRMG